MTDDTIYIPIGFQCTTAEILKKQKKRICSFPFDWIISTPESIIKLLTILLDKTTDIKHFVNEEFFKIDGLLHFLKPEEFILHPHGNILFNSKYNLIFPHFQYNVETIEKMIKRFDRLRNYILNSSNKINFLFVNRLITDNNNLNDNILKFSINNQKINLNVKNNFTQLNNLLLQYIPSDRFKIIIINAVKEISNDYVFDKNINYNEIIPINNSNLTDEEIMKITI
jgi:hypothetical protein